VAEDYSLKGKKIWVAGHNGMVGKAMVRRLGSEGCDILIASRQDLDLCNQAAVSDWMEKNRPHSVVVAAAKVGGIKANNEFPADFLYDNLIIEANIIHSAWKVGVEKLLFLGSSCIYPRLAEQPMREDALMTGPLEPTNEWYALAKIAGIKMCDAYRKQYGCDFISAMPTNLMGEGDNYDLETGHVVAALIVKAHRAKKAGAKVMELWGTGTPLREFLFVDDLADGMVFLMKHYSQAGHINIGSGIECSIAELAQTVAKVAGFQGKFLFDTNKPDGTPRKLMDSSRIHAMGWTAKTSLEEALRASYQAYVKTVEN
jgi:GDP-L-fucose synthase